MASLALCATVGRSHKVKNSDSGPLRIQAPPRSAHTLSTPNQTTGQNNGLWKVGKLNLFHSCDAIKGKRKRKPLAQQTLTVFDNLRERHANVPEAAHWNHLDTKVGIHCISSCNTSTPVCCCCCPCFSSKH
ncbi:unnamed protein product [Chondrus crispus]|uniref:Uncharacterized protein n=1 Tax=Chondrus crispus TaxID=2769 RepID=R7Q999_CHOCR|nr:unnamed protein product [Chondrus crispus]CDF35107.1 unnamed protein product [Chondrus crispus]|eukprot:XP_005714926.1 unnamed protein product [Chondrus crispus]